MNRPSVITDRENVYDGYHKYDKAVATTYDETRRDERHWQQESEYLRDYLHNRTFRTLLDLPVGTGRFLPLYAGIPSVTGVDISSDMLAEARAKADALPFGQKVVLEPGDVFNLRYSDRSFDVVVVFRLFHLMPPESLEQAVGELCRVAAGEIVVQTYTPSLWYRAFWGRLKRLIPSKHVQWKPKAWSHIRSFNHPQPLFNRLFQKFGFHVRCTNWLSSYEGCEVRATVYEPIAIRPGLECDQFEILR